MVEMKETTPDKRTASRIGYWREQVEQQERSGLTVKRYCERHGVSEQSFYVWRKRLREEAPVRFALVETSPQKEQRMMSAWKLFSHRRASPDRACCRSGSVTKSVGTQISQWLKFLQENLAMVAGIFGVARRNRGDMD